MRFLGAVTAAVLFIAPAWARLPASYSLNDHGMVIPIKDQGDLGTCWAFSSTTVFEYSLIKNHVVSSHRAGNLVSEWDMAIHAGTPFSLLPPYSGWGSSPLNSFGYLTRGFGQWTVKGISKPAGSGPVARNASPFNAYPLGAAENDQDLAAYLPPANQPSLGFRLVQAVEFESKSGAGIPPTAAHRARLKQAILDYGALDASINASHLSADINLTYDTYAYTGSSDATDHLITVIGWNDYQPVYNKDGAFLGYGAWLIQNSWGEHFAPQNIGKRSGCFWLGYMDTVALKYAAAMVTEARGSVSPTVIQNQIFYPTGQDGSLKGISSYAAARLTPQTDTHLLALGLWAGYDHTVVDITLFPEWGPRGPVGTPLASLRRVLIPIGGYSEVPLRAPVPLAAGQTFYVVVNYGKSYDHPVPVDGASLKVQTPTGGHYGLSWISSDGVSWSDLTRNKHIRGIFPIKGIQGGAFVGSKAAVLAITGLRNPIATSASSITLRGTASNNTRRIYYRNGDSGPVSSVIGRGSWKITVHGLRAGRNVLEIWPAAAKGVVTAPIKVTVVRTS